MGAKIMSQGVGGLRGILLIMGKEKEMEGSGLGETRLLSVLVSTNVCSESVILRESVCFCGWRKQGEWGHHVCGNLVK